ncbi:unnamed protein product [Cuscuta epithymum]|uniref:DNA helicase Pif1-like 2B domain-containing protein n=1 Tax=Cuscuta epithymum TaxID=186058 RepID=A0AAV0DRV9_9ASTE|nr:unnamed protein product [Cuscuta epithymum]
MYTLEFLDSLSISGLSDHDLQLHLKIGAPIMLLRNIDQPTGFCNGTRLIILTKLRKNVLEAKIITGRNMRATVHIPRVSLSPSDVTLPFNFQMKQFSVMVCFAMSINKSQS